MEPRLGQDLSAVRIHTGSIAAESAEALGAKAYALRSHIVFGRDQPEPSSSAGRWLLAHELAHVGQQASGGARIGIQAKDERPPTKPKPITFKLTVSREMGPDELLREFVRQYYNLDTDKDIEKKLSIWQWQRAGGRRATPADVKRGYLLLPVVDYAQVQFAGFSKEEQEAVNAETDRRFWEETGYKAGQKLGSSPEDKEMARKWMGVRADVQTENEKSRAINALPDDVKHILFGGNRKVSPDEYDTILKLAQKISKLTPEERQDYLEKVNTGTNSWSDVDSSLDRYMLGRRVQEAEDEKTEAAASKLFGLEELYKLYRAKDAAWVSYTIASARGGYSPRLLQKAETASERFEASLEAHHFASESDFEETIRAYRLRFRSEAAHLALEILARFDHMLYLERQKFQDPANAAALVQAIGATKAREHYSAAAEQFSAARGTRMSIDPDDTQDALESGMRAIEFENEGKRLEALAGGEVIQASGNDPLVDPKAAGRGTDREKLASLDAGAAQRYLMQVIDDRLADTGKARREFTEDPDRIFSLPDLVSATLQTQGIGDDTIYAWIVRDYIADERARHLFSAIVLGILALVLAFLVPGGGWLAAAALIANAGISTYQAFQAIKEYQEQEVDYRLKFIQDEPSLLWVGIAVAAAALDLGMTTTQLFKMSAAGLKELEVPLKEFAAASDAESAAARLQTLTAKIDAVETLNQEVKDALKARAAAEAGFSTALGKVSSRMLGVAGAVDPTPLFESIYYSIKRGANTITKLRKEAKLIEALGDVTKMTGATRQELTTTFEQIKKVVQLGERRGMDEATVLKYVDRLAAERSGGEGAFELITDEMSAWRKPTADQVKAEAELARAHETLQSLRQTKADLEAELRAGPKTLEGNPDYDRIKEIREDLAGLDDVKGSSRAGEHVAREGEITKAERAFSEAELLAERAQVDPKVIMRRAFGASKERAEVIAGQTVDQVGKLRTPAQSLTVDHIVSIKQVSEMEGFAKLTAKERNWLATMKKNLIVMDSSANSSKGERSWAAWRQYSTFYDEETKTAMIARESDLRTEIQQWIADKVRAR